MSVHGQNWVGAIEGRTGAVRWPKECIRPKGSRGARGTSHGGVRLGGPAYAFGADIDIALTWHEVGARGHRPRPRGLRPGHAGSHGLLEKDVVLDVAQRLGRMVSERLGAEVIYTRSDDSFVPLEGRVTLPMRSRPTCSSQFTPTRHSGQAPPAQRRII
jgi:hypothetical protein